MSQAQNLKFLLEDGEPHSTPEIQEKIYGRNHLGTARISARILDLKKKGLNIESWKDAKQKTIWWYRLVSSPAQERVPTQRIVGVVNFVHNSNSTLGSRKGQEQLFEIKGSL